MTLLYDPARDGSGQYCCAVCLHWYNTREEKQACMKQHGYDVLIITPKEAQ